MKDQPTNLTVKTLACAFSLENFKENLKASIEDWVQLNRRGLVCHHEALVHSPGLYKSLDEATDKWLSINVPPFLKRKVQSFLFFFIALF